MGCTLVAWLEPGGLSVLLPGLQYRYIVWGRWGQGERVVVDILHLSDTWYVRGGVLPVPSIYRHGVVLYRTYVLNKIWKKIQVSPNGLKIIYYKIQDQNHK